VYLAYELGDVLFKYPITGIVDCCALAATGHAEPKSQRGDTNVPGVRICEHFPLMSKHMDKVALIRSMHTEESNHSPGRMLRV